MCSVYGMLYSVAVNGRTFVILFGGTFLDRFLFDHETVSILYYMAVNITYITFPMQCYICIRIAG